MQDFFKNYHKKKALSHLGIFSISAILAVSINMFVLSGNSGASLKANILETTNSVQKVDLQIQHNQNTLDFTNTQEMKDVTEISISLAYNPELVDLLATTSSILGSEITTIENEPGFSNYIITLSVPSDIAINTAILSILENKNSGETAHLNPININFTDSLGDTFILSSEAIIF